MADFGSRPPDVAEAIKILNWPLNTREHRAECLAMWGEMGADVDQIKAKFKEAWKGRKK